MGFHAGMHTFTCTDTFNQNSGVTCREVMNTPDSHLLQQLFYLFSVFSALCPGDGYFIEQEDSRVGSILILWAIALH